MCGLSPEVPYCLLLFEKENKILRDKEQYDTWLMLWSITRICIQILTFEEAK